LQWVLIAKVPSASSFSFSFFGLPLAQSIFLRKTQKMDDAQTQILDTIMYALGV
jgi:hypothetical protein